MPEECLQAMVNILEETADCSLKKLRQFAAPWLPSAPSLLEHFCCFPVRVVDKQGICIKGVDQS